MSLFSSVVCHVLSLVQSTFLANIHVCFSWGAYIPCWSSWSEEFFTQWPAKIWGPICRGRKAQRSFKLPGIPILSAAKSEVRLTSSHTKTIIESDRKRLYKKQTPHLAHFKRLENMDLDLHLTTLSNLFIHMSSKTGIWLLYAPIKRRPPPLPLSWPSMPGIKAKNSAPSPELRRSMRAFA